MSFFLLSILLFHFSLTTLVSGVNLVASVSVLLLSKLLLPQLLLLIMLLLLWPSTLLLSKNIFPTAGQVGPIFSGNNLVALAAWPGSLGTIMESRDHRLKGLR